MVNYTIKVVNNHLTKDAFLKPINSIERILGEKRLRKLGFEKPKLPVKKYLSSTREKKKVQTTW